MYISIYVFAKNFLSHENIYSVFGFGFFSPFFQIFMMLSLGIVLALFT